MSLTDDSPSMVIGKQSGKTFDREISTGVVDNSQDDDQDELQLDDEDEQEVVQISIPNPSPLIRPVIFFRGRNYK